MRERLAKLACTSATIRRALVKRAGVLGAIGGYAVKNPATAALAGGTAVLGGMGAKGTYQKNKAGFDPVVQKHMLGQTPVPPGSEG